MTLLVLVSFHFLALDLPPYGNNAFKDTCRIKLICVEPHTSGIVVWVEFSISGVVIEDELRKLAVDHTLVGDKIRKGR